MGKRLQVVSTYLPDNCWELIFRKVQGTTSLKPISLVCKHFLSISNLCPITIYYSEHTFLPQLFVRFKNINKISIWAVGDSTLSNTLFQLAGSGLNLHTLVINVFAVFLVPKDGWKELGLAMKNLNCLHCPNCYCLNDDTLSVIVSSMANLKVLHIGTQYKYEQYKSGPPVSDRGIEILAASLPRSEEIDISGFTLLSDDSFDALSSKCKFLRVVKADGLPEISHLGIGYVLGRARHLEYLSCKRLPGEPCCFERSSKLNCEITCEKALGSMRFSHGNLLNHELIGSIVNAKIPLKKLQISKCQHTTNVFGLIAFLTGHPSLTCLEIEFYDPHDLISDNFIADLCPYLSYMKSICFKGGKLNLGRSSFLNLTKSCPALEEFRVETYMNRPLFIWVSTGHYPLHDEAEQKIRQAYLQCSLFWG